MKKLNVKRILNLRSFALAGIFLVAVFAVSCDKADDGFLGTEAVELKAGHLPGNKPDVSPDNRAPKPGDLSIAGLAEEFGIFNHLLEALAYVDEEEGTNLVWKFSMGTDQYTVFAPTDGAFEALFATAEGALGLDPGTVTSIEQLPSSLVLTVLQYHVTDGRRAANSVVPKNNYREIETWLGVTFDVYPPMDGKVNIHPVCTVKEDKTSEIILPNQSASNGIVHAIDAVLLPVNLATVVEILTSEED